MRRKDPVRDTPVSAWLQKHNPAVQIINNAVGGTTSRTTAECFDAMVGKDASSFCSTATTTGGQLHPAGGQGYSSGDVSAVLWLQSVCPNMKHVYMVGMQTALRPHHVKHMCMLQPSPLHALQPTDFILIFLMLITSSSCCHGTTYIFALALVMTYNILLAS